MSTTKADAIRPFTFHTPQAQLDELRRRIAATRWPTKELVEDRSQGVQLATLRELARYWTTEYDWRTCEARLNALPQFTTEIDEVEIHFIHVRSGHENALPLIMTHGWPGSVIELLETVGPLTDPTAHGGTPEDAFHLVLPSLPGYGFSGEPTELGWESGRIARAWAELMDRLGYTRSQEPEILPALRRLGRVLEPIHFRSEKRADIAERHELRQARQRLGGPANDLDAKAAFHHAISVCTNGRPRPCALTIRRESSCRETTVRFPAR
jgi:hypothetical protein